MRTLLYVRPAVASPAVVSTFASTLRAEQLRHLDAVRRACAILEGHAGRLPALASAQGALTRQWFDAQRSLLARCAEIDAEVDDVDVLDARGAEVAHDVAAAQRQLADVLDSWWEVENGRAAERLAASAPALMNMMLLVSGAEDEADDVVAGAVTADPDAELELLSAQCAVTEELPVMADVVTTALPPDLLELLDRAEASGLASLLDAMAVSLGTSEPMPTAVPQAATVTTIDGAQAVAEIEVAELVPRDLVIREDLIMCTGAPAGHGTRSTRHDEHGVAHSVVRNIVVPMVTTTVALGLLMVWIG